MTSPNSMEPNGSSQFRHGLIRLLLSFAVMVMGAQITTANAADLTPHDLILLDRLTFGINASSAAHLQAVGVERWLNEQLHPAPNSPLPGRTSADRDDGGRAQASVRRSGLRSMPGQKRQSGCRSRPEKGRATGLSAGDERAGEAGRGPRTILRDLYSPDQLAEQMTWFWFNHFNVHQYKSNLRVLVGDYEERRSARTRSADSAICWRRRCAIRRCCATSTTPTTPPATQRELRPRDHGTAHHGRRLRLHPEGRAGTGAHPHRRRHRCQAGRPEAEARAASRSWSATACSSSIRTGTTTATRSSSATTIKGAGFAEVDEALDILVAQPATAHPSVAADRDLFRLRRSAATALVRTHGADLQAHRRRHRRGAGDDVPVARVQGLA